MKKVDLLFNRMMAYGVLHLILCALVFLDEGSKYSKYYWPMVIGIFFGNTLFFVIEYFRIFRNKKEDE